MEKGIENAFFWVYNVGVNSSFAHKGEMHMRKYLLSESGSFYKANLHCHTTFSDGKLTPAEVKEVYKKLGYSIVAYTDHDILVPHDELNDEGFLALHGFEMEVNEPKKAEFPCIKTCHVCFIGIEPENITQPMWHRAWYLFGNAPSHRGEVKFDENEPDFVREYSHEGINKIMRIGREKGFFVTYNHPTWSLENYRDYIGYHGMHAMEVFNGSSNQTGFNDRNDHAYDDILRGGERIYCIGADDNHNHANPASRRFDSGWAWTVIKADSLDYRAVTRALVDGNFYASEGPEITALWYENGWVHVECSDADYITLTTDIRHTYPVFAEEDEHLNSADLFVDESCKWFRITVSDKRGRKACTNAYYLEDLNK